MTVNEMIQQLITLKETFGCGDSPIAMCKGIDGFGHLIFQNTKHITLNLSRTETDAGVLLWGN